MSYLSALLIVLAVPLSSIAQDTGRFKITSKKDNDQIEVKTEMDKVILVVHSPSGISDVVLERVDDAWPDAFVLQLHLSGLESFIVTNGKTTLNAAVSSSDGRVRLWKDGNEDSVLDAKSSYWMPVRIISSDGQPTQIIPLRGGYFEVKLPRKFFEENPKSITLKWIDFYRS
ncbi:MAG TPA: hypothetical protein VNQ76_19665 [Planctomicrobium sp.]|nr:hypothetical protein [Planctomicrobium sp.]